MRGQLMQSIWSLGRPLPRIRRAHRDDSWKVRLRILREAGIESPRRGTPMKDHLPNSHDQQRERARAHTERNLNSERLNGHSRRPSWQRRALSGLILGSFFFLIVSCFYAMQLDEPKIDRSKFDFQHRP